MNKIIEAEGLTKIYRGNLKAVDNISFSVDESEVSGYLGYLAARRAPGPE